MKAMNALLCLGWLVTLAGTEPVLAQADRQASLTKAPAAVLSAVQKVGHATGKSLTSSPDTTRFRISPNSGRNQWQMSWRDQAIDVDVDSTLGKVTRVANGSSFRSAIESEKAHEFISVSEEQAIKAVKQMSRLMEVSPGDWRITDTKLLQPVDNTDYKKWQIRITRYVSGHPVISPGIFGVVNPYNGTVAYWAVSYEDYVFNRTSALVSEEQARQIAVTALRQGGGPSDVEPQVELGWVKITHGSSLYRLAYYIMFVIKDEQGKPAAGVEAVVDGETGELWRIECVTEGRLSNFTSSSVHLSKRMLMASKLLADPHGTKLGLAVAGGSLLKQVKPQVQGQVFFYEVEGKRVKFILNTKNSELACQDENRGSWFGVRLSKTGLVDVVSWLKANARVAKN